MTLKLTVCSVVVIVEGPDGAELVMRQLAASMEGQADVTRQLPTRLYVSPHQGTVRGS